jgi:hypothetical protein
MVTIVLLAAAFAALPDSVHYRAIVRPASAVFEFPVQYDTAWTIGNPDAPAGTPAYEWTVSTAVRDTVFSFGYLLNQNADPAIPFAEARARHGVRGLFVNGSADRTVSVHVAFEAGRVVVRLADAAAIRRIFGLHPRSVQFSYRFPGRERETVDVPVEYAESAQQPGDFADSTFLRLVLDLPVLGTFSYDVVTRDRVLNVYSEIREADIEGCVLSVQIRTQQIGQGAQARLPQNFFGTTIAIPLDGIDPKSLTIQAAHPLLNSRYEPQPWFLHIGLRADSKSRITVGNLERGTTRRTRSIDLGLKNHDAGTLVKSWLSDAVNRCGTWKTAPLKPVR